LSWCTSQQRSWVCHQDFFPFLGVDDDDLTAGQSVLAVGESDRRPSSNDRVILVAGAHLARAEEIQGP
jgi:hypothetical protein